MAGKVSKRMSYKQERIVSSADPKAGSKSSGFGWGQAERKGLHSFRGTSEVKQGPLFLKAEALPSMNLEVTMSPSTVTTRHRVHTALTQRPAPSSAFLWGTLGTTGTSDMVRTSTWWRQQRTRTKGETTMSQIRSRYLQPSLSWWL